jgi:DNA-binding GntR family transcriptional regulator
MRSEASFQNASGHAYEQIKGMIGRHELVQGQKITYDQLTAKLGMSKTPIINALARLEQEGFLISFPNRGFFIKEMSADEFANLCGIRAALEALSLKEFMERCDMKGLKAIERAVIAYRSLPDEGFPSRKRFALDAAFHLKIAECGGNNELHKLLRHIWEQLYLRNRIEGFPPQRYRETSKEHQDIFNAIRDGDTKKAVRIMENHLRKSKETALLVMQQNKESYKF